MDSPVIYGLYCVCHRDRGIRYVGQTIDAEARLRGHRYAANYPQFPVNYWVRKHGKENVRMVVLETLTNPADLDAQERHWIDKLETFCDLGKGGLNRTTGGALGGYSEDTRQRLREANSGESAWSKLTWKDVEDIRARYSEGVCTYSELAREYGVRVSAISGVVKNTTWIDPRYVPPAQRNAREYPKGEGAPHVKLDWGKVEYIRSSWPLLSAKDLADELHVSITSVSLVIQGKTWKDPNYEKPAFVMPEAQKQAISKSLKGRKKPEGHGENVSKAISGEKHGMSKLTRNEVVEIHRLRQSGVAVRDLCEKFGVAQTQIRRILWGQRWTDVYQEIHGG